MPSARSPLPFARRDFLRSAAASAIAIPLGAQQAAPSTSSSGTTLPPAIAALKPRLAEAVPITLQERQMPAPTKLAV